MQAKAPEELSGIECQSAKEVWNQLNHRLRKWVKWEKGLYKWAAVRWLKQQYKSTPNLFDHWKLVQLIGILEPKRFINMTADQGGVKTPDVSG